MCAVAAWKKCGDVLGNDGVHQQTNSSSLGSAPCLGNRTRQRHLQLEVHFPLVNLLIVCEQKNSWDWIHIRFDLLLILPS